MSTARKILSNTIAQILGKVFMAVLGIATIKIITSYLSVEQVGNYTFIYEFLAFFGIAADLGLFTIAVKEMSQDEDNIPKIIGNILSLRTILIFSLMGAAVGTAFLIPDFRQSEVALGVGIAAVTTTLTILNGTITSVLQAKLKMEIAAVAQIIGKIISVGFMAYVVFFGFPENNQLGFYALLAAGIIGNLVMLLTTNHFVRKITPLKYQIDLKLWTRVLVESLPLGLALILNAVYFRIDVLLIYAIRGEAETGIYGVAMRMLEQFTVLPLYFMNSVLPTLTRTIKEKSQKFRLVVQYSFDFLAAVAIPMVIGGFVLAFPIIFIIADPAFLSDISKGFYGSDIALQILIFALAFQFLSILFSFMLIAINEQTKLLYINGTCAVLNIILNLLIIPTYGFRGAAATSVFCEFFILTATILTARHYVKFSLNLKNLLKITFSALVMGIAIHQLIAPTYQLVQNWNVVLLIPLGALIYGTLLLATRTITKDMLAVFKR